MASYHKQPTTWAGFALMATQVTQYLPERYQGLVQGLISIVGFGLMVYNERKSGTQPASDVK